MEKKRIFLLIYCLIGFIVVAGTSFLLFKYFRKWSRIRAMHEYAKETKQEMGDYQQLGFANDSELMQLLEGKLQRAYNRVTQLEKQNMYSNAKQNSKNKKQLEKILTINKKMLLSYLQDVQEFRKLGVETGNNIISFSHDKIVRLTIALAEIERQLNGSSDSTQNEFTKRLERMQEISKQSIAQFKQELLQYKKSNLPENNPTVQFVKTQITKKMRALHQLEELLVRN